MDTKKAFYISLVLIALGVSFSTTLSDHVGSIGTVFIAIGGLFLIIALNKRNQEKKEQKES